MTMNPPRRAGGVLAIWISSPDGRDHAVADAVLARTPDGRFLARCGTFVVSDSLCAHPGRRCVLCESAP
ncbi:hypothetical protein BJF78_22630 [Pseudonocardia sp. CNS-139]|nr:hypothetical protein BJF78_22630 [Pseudonocardia sp. CNS-139]